MEPLQVGMRVRCGLDSSCVLLASEWFTGTIMCIHEREICIKRDNPSRIGIGGGCNSFWLVAINAISDNTLVIISALPKELKDKDRATKDQPISLEEIAFYRWESCKNGVRV